MEKKRNKVIAEFSIRPIGQSTGMSDFVKAAYEALSNMRGIRVQLNPMSTVMEADSLSQVLEAVAAAHEAVFRKGAKRVDFILRVDDRRDKPRVMEDKVRAVLE